MEAFDIPALHALCIELSIPGPAARSLPCAGRFGTGGTLAAPYPRSAGCIAGRSRHA